jgi:hypothetical protein
MVSELIYGVLISGIFLIIGIVATIIGQEYSTWRNHQRRMDFMQKEILFKKKLDYFENLMELLETNLKISAEIIKNIRNDDKLEFKKSNNDFFENIEKLKSFTISKSEIYNNNKKIWELFINFLVEGKKAIDKLTINSNTKNHKELEQILNPLCLAAYQIVEEIKKEINKHN